MEELTFTIKEASDDESNIEWVNWYDSINATGVYELPLSRVSFNADKNAIYLIGEETATTVYTQHHENAKFKTGTTHGIRVVNAMARLLKLTGEVTQTSLFDGIDTVMESKALTVKALKTDKGVLWTIY